MKSGRSEATRRTFLGSGLAAGSVWALSGPAKAFSAPSPEQASKRAMNADGTVFGSQDIRVFCSANGADTPQIVRMVGRGPDAAWIGGLNVFDNGDATPPVAGAYQHTLGVERYTLVLSAATPPVSIEMRPRQVHLWHIVNRAPGMSVQFQPFGDGSDFQWRQAAKDDVPLVWENFNAPANLNAPVALGPGERADLLVQAPALPGYHVLNTVSRSSGQITAQAAVKVNPGHSEPRNAAGAMREFPSSAALYPQTPAALLDISAVTAHRTVTFTSASAGAALGADAPLISLPAAEEWRVSNTTPVARTLHFPGMPVQLLDMFDPSTMSGPKLYGQPWLWADTIQIPAANSVPGTVTLRLRGGPQDGSSPYVWGGPLFRSV